MGVVIGAEVSNMSPGEETGCRNDFTSSCIFFRVSSKAVQMV